ncbi:MAG: ATP synthase F1 subunit gamma [Bacteroidaceae bacterium]|nr:ATP synthase F1 subunit gamma [Bacteroidaceae bacterium]MBR4783503.1 ATP synthase F1 subunit gamma [Bacteroidaceae bacterium]
MPSLKEVKLRINSVSSTRKITSAMKLVASSKLRKAQQAIGGMRPYQQRLDGMLSSLAGEIGEEFSSPIIESRKLQRAVVVALSSNSSLCGAFNANVIKAVLNVVNSLTSQGVAVEVLPIGQKMYEKIRKNNLQIFEPGINPDVAANVQMAKLLDRPNYTDIAAVATSLMKSYECEKVDKVVLVYNHFKNTATQVVTTETLLPVALEASVTVNTKQANDQSNIVNNYIIEPSCEELLKSLLPKGVSLKLYTAILDSLAAEHSARVIAMQTATDNADQLLHDLTLMYNKTRQAAITAELLDIVGASFQ